jgi:hypothetical protein
MQGLLLSSAAQGRMLLALVMLVPTGCGVPSQTSSFNTFLPHYEA